MSIRTRLDSLTTKIWAAVDTILDTTDPDPDPDSIAAMNAEIDASNTAITLRTGDDNPVPELDAQITAITDIAAPSRTQEQKDMLALLRLVKKMNAEQVSQARRIVNLQRRVKTLQRNLSIVGRFAMFLDGGPSRVRQEDIDGDE